MAGFTPPCVSLTCSFSLLLPFNVVSLFPPLCILSFPLDCIFGVLLSLALVFLPLLYHPASCSTYLIHFARFTVRSWPSNQYVRLCWILLQTKEKSTQRSSSCCVYFTRYCCLAIQKAVNDFLFIIARYIGKNKAQCILYFANCYCGFLCFREREREKYVSACINRLVKNERLGFLSSFSSPPPSYFCFVLST